MYSLETLSSYMDSTFHQPTNPLMFFHSSLYLYTPEMISSLQLIFCQPQTCPDHSSTHPSTLAPFHPPAHHKPARNICSRCLLESPLQREVKTQRERKR